MWCIYFGSGKVICLETPRKVFFMQCARRVFCLFVQYFRDFGEGME